MARARLFIAGMVAAALAFDPAPATSQTDKPTELGEPTSKMSAFQLPITRVSFFTSGVAYFQREGEVVNNAHVDLTFPVEEVNDLLKSLVLRDLSGGQIRAVGFDSQDPISKTLKDFAIDLGGNPTFGKILEQARGEKVEVTWQKPGTDKAIVVAGTILGVEKQNQQIGKDTIIDVEMLNLWSKEGMRSLKLSETSQIHFQNPALESEISRALEILARGHDNQKKTVRLTFTGKGKRRIQVGYVVAHPIWQASYRLMLNGKDKAYLQGWGILENPSSDDWNKVKVQLVSGRPISFRMDLYQPLYIERPLVELQRFASLRPHAYDGTFGGMAGRPALAADALRVENERRSLGKPMEQAALQNRMSTKEAVFRALVESVPSAAKGENLGEFFQYDIAQPVSLPRQKSAMLPTVTSPVQTKRVSIYNEKVQAIHPLLGLQLKNTTGLHLMQGPITVFEEDNYAGDALIRDMQPNEERLLSFAIDLGMEVKTEAKNQPEQVVLVKVVRGVAEKTILLRNTHVYKIKNRTAEERQLIIEQPNRSPEFKLVTPAKPSAVTRDTYRFNVVVPADGTASYEVLEERKVVQQVYLGNADDQTLRLLVESPGGSKALQTALKKATEIKAKLAGTLRDIGLAQGQLKGIEGDQTRQRENMKVIPQTDPIYKKYLEKFLKQETDIERLRSEITKLQVAAAQHREEYATFVQNLTIDD